MYGGACVELWHAGGKAKRRPMPWDKGLIDSVCLLVEAYCFVCTGAYAELWRAGGMGGRGRMGPQPQRACIQDCWRQHGLQALPPPAPLHKTADRFTVRPCIGPSSQFEYAQSCGRAACWACCVPILLPLRVRGLNLPRMVAMDKRHQSRHHAPPMCLLRYLFCL